MKFCCRVARSQSRSKNVKIKATLSWKHFTGATAVSVHWCCWVDRNFGFGFLGDATILEQPWSVSAVANQALRGRGPTVPLGYFRVSPTRIHKQQRAMRFKVSGTLVIKIPSVLEGFQSDKQLPSFPPLLLFLAPPPTLFTRRNQLNLPTSGRVRLRLLISISKAAR